MKRVYNKSINYGIKILSILAFGIMLMPTMASAQNYFLGGFGGSGGSSAPYNYSYDAYYPSSTSSYYNGSGNTYSSGYSQSTAPTPPPTSYVAPTPVVYSSTVNQNSASSNSTNRIVARNSTSSANKSAASLNTVSGLAANAFYGSNSFLPSGIVQWIIFAIFILLLVILARIVFGGRENYHSTPLKHD